MTRKYVITLGVFIAGAELTAFSILGLSFGNHLHIALKVAAVTSINLLLITLLAITYTMTLPSVINFKNLYKKRRAKRLSEKKIKKLTKLRDKKVKILKKLQLKRLKQLKKTHKNMIKEKQVAFKNLGKASPVKEKHSEIIKNLKKENTRLQSEVQGINTLWGKSIEKSYKLESQLKQLQKEMTSEKRRHQTLFLKYEMALKELKEYEQIVSSKIFHKTSSSMSLQNKDFIDGKHEVQKSTEI